MSIAGHERARAAALAVLAAAEPGVTGDPPVTASFRCWTPLSDWTSGAQASAALRDVLAALRDAGKPRLDVVIADDDLAVVETTFLGGGKPVNCTFVVTLRDRRADEVRCYLDPRTLDPGGGH